MRKWAGLGFGVWGCVLFWSAERGKDRADVRGSHVQKEVREIRKTTFAPTCIAACVSAERPARKPCAAE